MKLTFIQALVVAFVGGMVIGLVGSAIGTPFWFTLVLCAIWGLGVSFIRAA